MLMKGKEPIMNKIRIRDEHSVAIANDMFGLFFEDINYSLDGGLYAEMLENRNFEAIFSHGELFHYKHIYDGGYAWSLYGVKGLGEYMHFDNKEPLNEVNPHYMIFESAVCGSAFTNKAYDGIYMKANLAHQVSFYARVMENPTDVTVSIIKDGVTYASECIKLEGPEAGWKKYTCTLTSESEVAEAAFVVKVLGKSKIAFDQFSMMPGDAVCGLFRKDLAEILLQLKPSFLRFPGGCVVEGNSMANRYQWKKSLGPVETREFNWNRWSVHETIEGSEYAGPYAHYGQTLGVGYYEYFLLCEYLKAQALPVIGVGVACQFMAMEQVAIDSPEFEECVQDALDLIEFANGSADSQWGSIRASMGHPEPFNLKYLGVGNEQWQTEVVDFHERAEIFEKRIHEKYPEIQIIGSAGPDVSTEKYDTAWKFLREKCKDNPNFVYAVDEHYYVNPEWLYNNTHFYDNYDRNIKVFAGEYACHIPGKSAVRNSPEANTLGAALAEAAFITGVERNSDVVVLASYAPLLARMGYTQWSPDMIWFNGKDCYGTPSYYVQQMFSCNRGVRTLAVDWSKEQEEQEKMYMNAVINQDNEVILKVANASAEEKALDICLDHVSGVDTVSEYQVTEIFGNPDEYNTILEPNKIVPQVYVTKECPVLKPNSFAVIVLKK